MMMMLLNIICNWKDEEEEEEEEDDDEEEKDIGILCSYQLLASPKECEKLNKANFDGAPENKV